MRFTSAVATRQRTHPYGRDIAIRAQLAESRDLDRAIRAQLIGGWPRPDLGGEQLLAAQRGEDLDRGARPVERVEVEARHAGFEQLRALRDAVPHAEGADGVVGR